ncbi:MAG: NAD(P)/FAD-dependent oxidoreductase [Acholeplasmatales bacterium]|jgi:thioredoxin reductase (NADPH)|nr:NAD(P)/FAD-dependent oxidoreductase [Acholeplasmatales bacterium]
MWDVIVVGGGPCGLSAATYLKRFNRQVLVLSNEDSILKKKNLQIDNYFGVNLENGTLLIDNTMAKLQTLGVQVEKETVLDIVSIDGFLRVITNKQSILTKYVVLGIGLNYSSKVKNVQKYLGKGISYCASCDGFFYLNKTIGLFGSGDYLLHELDILKNITNKILIFTPDELKLPKYQIIPTKDLKLQGTQTLEAVLANNQLYPIDGLFIADDSPGILGFAGKLGLELKNNSIVVDQDYATSIKSIYAGGDCIGGIKQITKASYDGMMIAYAINQRLNNE